MSVALLSPPSMAGFPFVIARISAGWPVDQITNVAEPLVTAGVDGKRIRVRRREYPQFQMETWIDATDYATGVGIARNYLTAVGLPCSLDWAAAGFSGTWSLVLVEKCEPSVAIGSLTGAGTTDATTAIVRALWTLTAQGAGVAPGP